MSAPEAAPVPGAPAGGSPVRSSCSTSACNSSKGWPAGGLKHTPAWGPGTSPVVTCRVTAAPGSANKASRLALTGLLRPRRVSSRPMAALPGSGLVELGLEAGQLLQALLQGGVGREQRRDARPPAQCRGEVEGVEVLGGPKVAGGDPAHLPRHLDQGGRQQRGPADEDRTRAT